MAKARPGARYWTARRKRAAARLALFVVVLALFSIPAPRYYERRRQRLTHIAALDPHFREEWEADRPWRLPGSCESRLGAVLPLDPTAAAFSLERSRLYGEFASGLEARGLDVFSRAAAAAASSSAASTTQGLGLSDLFDFHPRSGRVTARLHRLDVPVRAVVLPLPAASRAAARIHRTTRRVLGEHFPGYGSKDGLAGHGDSVWYQDPTAYHFSVYHASHHLAEVRVTPEDERLEAAAIAAASKRSSSGVTRTSARWCDAWYTEKWYAVGSWYHTESPCPANPSLLPYPGKCSPRTRRVVRWIRAAALDAAGRGNTTARTGTSSLCSRAVTRPLLG